MRLFRLDKRIALVTGAGAGIGRAIAVALARAGADVAITEIDSCRAGAEATAAQISEHGRRGFAITLDVTRVADIETAVAKIEADFGPIDILVNNAGINIHKYALDVGEDDWDRVLNVDLKGVFFISQACARRMLPRGRGAIVNIASIYGVVGYHRRAPYAAAKGGLVNLTRALALEWAKQGVRVNAVAPSFILTPMTEKELADPLRREENLSRVPTGRLGLPEDVAAAVLYLASDAADMITGHTLMLDGGYTAG